MQYTLEYYTDDKITAKKAFEYVSKYYGEYIYNYDEQARVKNRQPVIKCSFSFIINNQNHIEEIRNDISEALGDIIKKSTDNN